MKCDELEKMVLEDGIGQMWKCYDCPKCENCELMNKAERCIKTIKELANRFVAHKKYVGYPTAIQYKGKDDVIYLNESAADKFKRDIMKAIREAYK